MMNDTANITIAMKYDVACELSISVFSFDLGLFWRLFLPLEVSPAK